jgi:hypothetical protein
VLAVVIMLSVSGGGDRPVVRTGSRVDHGHAHHAAALFQLRHVRAAARTDDAPADRAGHGQPDVRDVTVADVGHPVDDPDLTPASDQRIGGRRTAVHRDGYLQSRMRAVPIGEQLCHRQQAE